MIHFPNLRKVKRKCYKNYITLILMKAVGIFSDNRGLLLACFLWGGILLRRVLLFIAPRHLPFVSEATVSLSLHRLWASSFSFHFARCY